MRNIFWGLCIAIFLSGCASTKVNTLSEAEYYHLARTALKSDNFNEAALQLEALETNYPFGRFSEQAQLDMIYAKYSNLNISGARSAAERFIRLHPQSEHIDYAYYMKGIIDFNADIGISAQYVTAVDDSKREPGSMRKAFNDFSELITRFPNSVYAPDAAQRMVFIRNRLARFEIHIAKYYIKRQAYLAAANRAEGVVANYPKTPSVQEALIIMVETYRKLGLEKKANDALSVLATNFPSGIGFTKNHKFKSQMIENANRSLLGVVSFGLFK